jgi:hypothetical protein
MFKFKKLFFLIVLVALLAAAVLPASSAFALMPHNARYALVKQASAVGNQPATIFRLRGTYMCDKVQLASAISGKVITIYVYDINLTPNGNRCSQVQSFNRVISVGRLAPGRYTVIVNPTNPGLQQKKFTYITPLFFEPTLTKP